MEQKGVKNFDDSNIENKMKSYNIFWGIIFSAVLQRNGKRVCYP
jgi:hypothetical protein